VLAGDSASECKDCSALGAAFLRLVGTSIEEIVDLNFPHLKALVEVVMSVMTGEL